MEIKVKALDGSQEKSQSEKEQELLNKHEGQEQTQETVTQQEEVETSTEAPQEDIISYLKNKHNKEITSVDELFQKREEEPLPEDVASYLKYKKDTGRGFEDYVKLNRDFENYDSDTLLREYLTETEEGLDKEDIDEMLGAFYAGAENVAKGVFQATP